jgi:hypothetical protein
MHDVIDAGVVAGGRRHLFNPELIRDGMWRQLDPLVSFDLSNSEEFNQCSQGVLQVKEEHVDLAGEEGSIVRIAMQLPTKCLIESLNLYTSKPLQVRSVEFRGGINSSPPVLIPVSSDILVPNSEGLIKVFAPGSAEQIVVHLFRRDTSGPADIAKEHVVVDADDGSTAEAQHEESAASDYSLSPPRRGHTTNRRGTPAASGNVGMQHPDLLGSTVSPAQVPDEEELETERLATDDGDMEYDEMEDEESVEGSDDSDDDDEEFLEDLDDDTEFSRWRGGQSSLTLTIVGFSLHHAPPPAAVVPLMNVSSVLRKQQRVAESVEADMLCGLALLRSRRFVQATEILRRAERNLFHKHAGNVHFSARARRAATFSLLAADGLSHVNQLYFKLEAFHRATEYMLMSSSDRGTRAGIMQPEMAAASDQSSIHPATDVKTGLQSLQPHLTHVLLSSLNDHILPVREASARGLQFVLDHVGCSIGTLFPLVLQHLVRVYPVDVDEKQPLHLQRHLPEERAVLLLETCYGMLPYFSRHILSETIVTVIEPYLIMIAEAQSANSASIRLSIILLRILMLVVGRLRGDMPLRQGLVVALLRLTKHEVAVVHRSSRRCWEAIACNIAYGVRRAPDHAGEILRWCADQIAYVNRARPRSARRGVSFVTKRMHDTVFYVASATRIVADAVATLAVARQNEFVNDGLLKLIPLLVKRIQKHCFTEEVASTSQSGALEAFKRLWECLVSVTRALPSELAPSLNVLALPFLKWAYSQSSLRSPSTALLGVMRILLRGDIVCLDAYLIAVPDHLDPTPRQFAMGENFGSSLSSNTETMQDFFLKFILVFAKWVPHSVKDDTFNVLKALIRFTAKSLTPGITRVVLQALLDRYTVRSKSYTNTIRYFVDVLTIGVPSDDESMAKDRLCLTVAELVQLEKQRLAELETRQANGDNIAIADDVADAKRKGEMRTNMIDAGSECFSFVLDFCTSPPSLPSGNCSNGSPDVAFRATSMRKQGDETEERLSFLFLCLIALREQPSSPERYQECLGCLSKALPSIGAYCTSLLDHPRADVQILAFHVMDLLSVALGRNFRDMKERAKLNHHLFLFLFEALKDDGETPDVTRRSPSLLLRCVFFVHRFLCQSMPALNDTVVLEESEYSGVLRASIGILPQNYSHRRFAYAVLLWERTAFIINSSWKNLRSVALWVLAETTEVIKAGRPPEIEMGSVREFNIRFQQKFELILPNLFQDDWECRLTATRMLSALLHRIPPGKKLVVGNLKEERVCELLLLASSDWHADVRAAANALLARVKDTKPGDVNKAPPRITASPLPFVASGSPDKSPADDENLSPAAHFVHLWEDHEKAFAELESLEDFVRGGGMSTTFLTGTDRPNKDVFESSVIVVPAPPEQAFLDSFLAKTDSHFGEDEDDLADDSGVIDVEYGEENELDLGDAGVVVEEGDGSFEEQMGALMRKSENEGIVENDPSVSKVPPVSASRRKTFVGTLSNDQTVSSDCDGDTSDSADYTDSNYNELQDQLSSMQEYTTSGLPPKTERPRSAPAKAKALSAAAAKRSAAKMEGRPTILKEEYFSAAEGGGIVPSTVEIPVDVGVEQSSVEGFVFEDDSTASEDHGESDEDSIPILRKSVLVRREREKIARQEQRQTLAAKRPTASSRTKRVQYSRQHGGDGSFEEAEVDEGFIYSDHFNEEDDDDELHHPVGGVNHHMLYNDDESGSDYSEESSSLSYPALQAELESHRRHLEAFGDEYEASGLSDYAAGTYDYVSSVHGVHPPELHDGIRTQSPSEMIFESSRPRVTAAELRSLLRDSM